MKLSQLHKSSPSNLLEYGGAEGYASIGTRANLQTGGLGSEGGRRGELRGGEGQGPSVDRMTGPDLPGDTERNIPGETGKRANTQKKNSLRRMVGGGERDPKIGGPTSWAFPSSGDDGKDPSGKRIRASGGRGAEASKVQTPHV